MALKNIQVIFATVLFVLVATGCTNTNIGEDQGSVDSSNNSSVVVRGSNDNDLPDSTNATRLASLSSRYVPDIYSAAGISVSGEGTVTLEPDLAILNVAIETEARTVVKARDRNAIAIDAILTTVRSYGVSDNDIGTTSFNIWPRYDYVDRTQILAGYKVSNSLTIKVRELVAIGQIIDSITDSGGDAIRVNGVSFTVDDPTPFMSKLREAAVNDATSKAQHYARLSGVKLGRLIHLMEPSSVVDASPIGRRSFAMSDAAVAPSTTLSSGELTIRLIVNAMFHIE